ncbi:MAG: aspartyl beta-hydroxylase, partial [Rhodanobacter sp.]
MSKPHDETLEGQRAIARQQAQYGTRDAAEQAFLAILERHPHDVEALRFIAECRSLRGDQAAA